MMKLLNMIALLILIWYNPFLSATAQEISKVVNVELKSEVLNQTRPLLIYTPRNYDERSLLCHNVIYVFDAQNRELFDLVHATLMFSNFPQDFIVVGVCSPANEGLNYYRNNDLLPTPKFVKKYDFIQGEPNAENFWKFFTQEVVPYVEQNFRTTSNRYAVGHSLSASFVLDKAVHDPEVFDGYIAVSPNFAYDRFRLANDFISFKYQGVLKNKLIYTSQGNEAVTMKKDWQEAYQHFKSFLNEKRQIGNVTFVLKEFPEISHWDVFFPSLVEGLKSLREFMKVNPLVPAGEAETITFRIKVPNKTDEAYLSGNQESLGNWNPAKVKLKKSSDFIREITLKVQYPLEFKITRGSWESQAATSENDGENIVISKADSSKMIQLKVLQWFDQ